jgi:spore maturation protein CgeB
MLSKVVNKDSRPSLTNYVHPFLVRRSHLPVFGLNMFQKLHDSKIVLNTHIDVSQTSASNMRLFEATGVGSCLLTDWKSNLSELFEPERDVATYRTPQECIDKANYLLLHENERIALAQAGQKRTLMQHTINLRAEQIDEIIRGEFKFRDAN